MKFTLSWLKEYLDTDASVAEIAENLTDLGLEVEEIVNPYDRLGAFTIGYVKHAEKHPDADKLKVCKVDTDEGELQIICGAPNARTGITVVVAKPGVYVPGIDTTISVGKIRGIESYGMMASEREMELSDEHDGIIELPSGEVGEKFVDWLAANDPAKVDPMIDIAITPNRPDALGVEGIARDLAARGLGTLKSKAIAPVAGSFESPIKVSIDADVQAKGCPVFYGRTIRGVKNGPSPKWLQMRLKAIGLRPISALVDITNYFTVGQNRPLHVFDIAKVQGDLRVHFAQGGEKIEALDEKEYTMPAGAMVISDDNGIESIAGIMGGASTGCQDDTVDVFLESAYWDPITIAKAGRAMKINSDARYRFERGVDPAFTGPGLEAATQMILDLCGGEASELVVAGETPDVSRAYRLDPARSSSLVGMDIAESAQRSILESLGFTLRDTAEGIMADVPSWRPDVLGEADLVEEVARVTSLTKLEAKPMSRPFVGVAKRTRTPIQSREAMVRRALAAAGMNECVTYSFVSQEEAAAFGGGQDAMRLENPISSEMSHMRPDPLPGLMAAAARNQARGFNDLALFEVGPAFFGAEPGEQKLVVSGVLVGNTAPREWTGARRPVDVFDVKALAEAGLEVMNAPADRLMVLRNVPDWYHPGRSAVLSMGPKNPLAQFGEVHPKIIDQFKLKGAVMAFTLFLENAPFPKAKGTARPALKASDFQAVERDFAFVMDADIEVEKMLKAVRGADKKLIESITVFDVFAGEQAEKSLGEGKKSVALVARIQPTAGTLTDEQIEAVSAKIVAAAKKSVKAELRA